jgi:hypothetical protein
MELWILTYDHGIGLFIDTPFFHLIFKEKSKFLFLINEGMYTLQVLKFSQIC